MSDVVSNSNLEAAYDHICKTRLETSHNNDIWDVRFNWATIKPQLQHTLLQGSYRLSPTQYCHTENGILHFWTAQDAIVLRAIAQVLAPVVGIAIDERCYHLKGRGGLKGGVRMVAKSVSQYDFVLRSDVASFYESMQKDKVLNACKPVIKDRRILRIIAQLIDRVDVLDGEHILKDKGIPRGCPLSPLIGGLMMKSLGARLPKGAFYAIYMDDWVVLTKTRGALRRAVKWMHRVMDSLGFKIAIDKTYIGRIKNGFEFLGYRFNHRGLVGLATKTIDNFIARLLKLYEQNSSSDRIEQYVQRWVGWCVAGL